MTTVSVPASLDLDLDLLKGPQGDRGPEGPRGPIGPQGAPGPAGPMMDLAAYPTRAEVAAMIQEAMSPVVVPPPPVIPPGAVIVAVGDKLVPKANTTYLLRGGTHHIGFGSTERHEAGVVIASYPGERAVIDGTGLDPHFAYLGTGAGYTLRDLAIAGFRALGSGVIGVGDACSLDLLRVTMTGLGAKSSTAHLVYCHGTGRATIAASSLTKAPGAALHCYRGTPVVSVSDSDLGGLYVSLMAYSGAVSLTRTRFVETTAAYDIEVGGDAQSGPGTVALDTATTGTGTGGKVRRNG